MSGPTTSAETFASLWQSGQPPPDVFDFVAALPDPSADDVVSIVRVDQQRRWQDGSGLRFDEYMHQLPLLGGNRDAQLALAVSEFHCRSRAGESPQLREYVDRFPGFAEALAAEDGPAERDPAELDTATIHPEQATLIPGNDAPAAGGGVDSPRVSLGDYELIEEIARGGMGVVIKARHVKLNRTVALKMILAGQFANADDIRRFYVEAEAAARLDHPNIVPIYEVGEINGQHFFAMRYVEGASLAGKISAGPLSPKQAARITRSVAAAVHYAHEKGVIHRDLKPANVLLDGNGQPLVTDFGLAKPIESDRGLTASGQILGTPGYMAPEQALGKTHETGPASDTYSLGAVLYALLTGRPPFQSASVLETLRHVVEREPAPPSQLNPSVPRDLETICLKCLSKEPAQRYATAEALADDLGCYLSGRPVTARPVSLPTRCWRWCRRNPVIAGLSAAVAVCLVVGTAVSTSLAFKASRRAAEAEANYIEARRNFERAWEVVDKYLTQVSENTLLNQPGMQPLQQELLREALNYYQQFVAEHGDEPALREELAGAHFRVGLITEVVNPDLSAAVPSFEAALAIQESLSASDPENGGLRDQIGDTLTAQFRVHFRLGKLDDAVEYAQRALDVRRLRESPGGVPEIQRELANSYMNLALVHRARDDLTGSRAFHEQAQSIRRAVLDERDSPDVRRDMAMGCYNLANLCLDTGDTDEALPHLRSAIEGFERILDEEPEDLANRYRLGICYQLEGELDYEAGEWERAAASFVLARDRLRDLAEDNPRVAQYRAQLAGVSLNLGQLQYELENLPAAGESLAAAHEWYMQLDQETPSARFQRGAADALHALAWVQWDGGDRQAAIDGLHRSAGLLTRLIAASGEDEGLAERLAEVQATLREFESGNE